MKRTIQGFALLIALFMIPTGMGCAWPTQPKQAVAPTDPPYLTAWIVNTNGTINPHWPTAPVNVQSVTQVTINGAPYVRIQTNSIADYQTTVTQQLLDELNGRPRAATDFVLGHTTATLGQIVRFGDNIGYSTMRCSLGYWPPGPGCPTSQNRTYNIPMQPISATTVVSTAMGAVGLWVNGTAVYNWADGQSYNMQNVWRNNAPAMEVYDMDVCPGHAPPTGDYHHHSYADCLSQLLGDVGSAHSPVYGFAADGYPIYGPYVGASTLAQSGWRTRDYNTPSSPTGCGTAYVRNCLLRNVYDPSQGTTPATAGPRTDATVTSMSGNVISATSGIYLQDHWYDVSCTTCLDIHNGHDHDGLGYHYHVTVQQNPSGGRPIPVFPYIYGPQYRGQLNPSITYTPTRTPTASAPTNTPTYTHTATATPTMALVGHVVWQGPPAQPDAGQQLPVTLTLKSGATEINYPVQNTDASGFFTVSLGSLPQGAYDWRVKGPKYLANSGTVTLNVQTIPMEMGLLRAGDCNNDNIVNTPDFNILKNTFGKALGDPGYDARGDFTSDNVVNLPDFNLQRGTFGQGGAPPIAPR